MVLEVQPQGLGYVGQEAILLLGFFPESLKAQGGGVFKFLVSAAAPTYLLFLSLPFFPLLPPPRPPLPPLGGGEGECLRRSQRSGEGEGEWDESRLRVRLRSLFLLLWLEFWRLSRPRGREVAERSLVLRLLLWRSLADEVRELLRWRLLLSRRAFFSSLSLKRTLLLLLLLSLLLLEGGGEESLELRAGLLEGFLDFFFDFPSCFSFPLPCFF